MIRFIGAVIIALLPASLAAQDALRMGLRADAPPFSSVKDGDTYEGFLVDLCFGALEPAGFDITPVRVEAGNRFDMLRRGGAGGGVDMLCDPTSIQAQILRDFLVSPQVFATGVGYLRKVYVDPPDEMVIGYLDGTTSRAAVEIALSSQSIAPKTGGAVRKQTVATHDEGIKGICDGTLEFYFGDLDILRALKKLYEADTPCPDVINSQQTKFSYEAYVLTVNPDRQDIALALQAGLYRVFSDGSATTYYKDRFGNDPRSNVLGAVFALNGALPCRDVVDPNPCVALADPETWK